MRIEHSTQMKRLMEVKGTSEPIVLPSNWSMMHSFNKPDENQEIGGTPV
jgi:hypothetical protein